MRGKYYYRGKAMIKWALAAHLFPILWFVITHMFLSNMVNSESSDNITEMTGISLAGIFLIPIAVIVSFVLSVIGIVFSSKAKKEKDIGAGKVLGGNIAIAAVMLLALGILGFYFVVFYAFASGV